MPSHDKDQTRPFAILLQLSQGSKTKKELAAHFGVCDRTIARAINTLLELRFEIEDDRNERNEVFYTLINDRFLDDVSALTPKELLALIIAKQNIDTLPFLPVRADFESLYNKVITRLPEPLKTWLSRLSGSIIQGNSQYKFTDNTKRFFDQIVKAISDSRQLEIDYIDAKENSSHRNIDPLRIIMLPDRIYLIAFCHNREEMRIFCIDKIQQLILTNKPSKVSPLENPGAFMANALFVFAGGKTEDIEIKLWGKALESVNRRMFHPSQQLRSNPSGKGAIMTLRIASLEEALKMVLEFGTEAKVIKPPRLVKMIRRSLQETLKNYEEATP